MCLLTNIPSTFCYRYFSVDLANMKYFLAKMNGNLKIKKANFIENFNLEKYFILEQ